MVDSELRAEKRARGTAEEEAEARTRRGRREGAIGAEMKRTSEELSAIGELFEAREEDEERKRVRDGDKTKEMRWNGIWCFILNSK